MSEDGDKMRMHLQCETSQEKEDGHERESGEEQVTTTEGINGPDGGEGHEPVYHAESP